MLKSCDILNEGIKENVITLFILTLHKEICTFGVSPCFRILLPVLRDSVRSTRGLGPTMTARGQSIGISIGMLPQTLIMSITVQKTSK